MSSCNYCEEIFTTEADLENSLFNTYEHDGIVKDTNGYNLVIVDQDGNRSINGIEFCPYCGRKLG